MKSIDKNQNEFVDTMDLFGQYDWTDKFNHIMSMGNSLPAQCPGELLLYRILTCSSITYFHAWLQDGELRVNGWSNAAVQRGIIAAIIQMFDHAPESEFTSENAVYFHTASGLLYNLTPLRKDGLLEMIRRIHVLFSVRNSDYFC